MSIPDNQVSRTRTTQCYVRKSLYTTEQQRLTDLLRQIRLEAGLTQAQLAQKLETPQTRISDYELGLRRLDLVQLQQVCEAVGISLRDFIDRYLDEPAQRP